MIPGPRTGGEVTPGVETIDSVVQYITRTSTDWAQWQTAPPKAKTPHSTTVLQPSPLLGVKVATQLDIATLGYSYA